MRVQAREELLDVWRSMISHSYRNGSWHWAGRSGTNSISDAEQLLCILYPATNVTALRIDNPDETAADVLAALRGLGNDLEILRVLTNLAIEYMERYLDDDGHPVFSGASYFDPTPQDDGGVALDNSTPEQRTLDMVDSFSMSNTLCLSVLGFIQQLRGKVQSRGMVERLDRLERLSSDRLTAAMTGLLRSFSVRVFDLDSGSGQRLCTMVNQADETDRQVGERLARNLRDIRSGLREELSIGSGLVAEQLDNPLQLFECGWSWGIIEGAPEIEYVRAVDGQRSGVADDRPYLYFTGVALDGIEDLFSERTRILGLLTDEQQRLAQALQLRWDLCLEFWWRIATFGSGRWPLEDLPWRTSDGEESDHWRLMVASMLVQRLHVRGGRTERATRIGSVLEELANRGRITRRPLRDDPALVVHQPGTRLKLIGTEKLGPPQTWTVSSYASMLMKRSVQAAMLTTNTPDRDRLLSLSDQVWGHLLARRLSERSGEGLWDDPAGGLPLPQVYKEPSWYHTQRVCECLVAVASTLSENLPTSSELSLMAAEYLAEAEHIFDQEKLHGTWAVGRRSSEGGLSVAAQSLRARIERARALRIRRPGTAIVLAQQVLHDLDELDRARSHSLDRDR